jgi:Leucine-rich repeat (LRR) protein
MEQLTFLDVSNNMIGHLPEAMGGLANLTRLYAADQGRLQRFPDSLGELERLEIIHAPNNALQSLPESFGGLRALRRLSLANNRIAASGVPRSLTTLPHLTHVVLDGNPLGMVPDGW